MLDASQNLKGSCVPCMLILPVAFSPPTDGRKRQAGGLALYDLAVRSSLSGRCLAYASPEGAGMGQGQAAGRQLRPQEAVLDEIVDLGGPRDHSG